MSGQNVAIILGLAKSPTVRLEFLRWPDSHYGDARLAVGSPRRQGGWGARQRAAARRLGYCGGLDAGVHQHFPSHGLGREPNQ